MQAALHSWSLALCSAPCYLLLLLMSCTHIFFNLRTSLMKISLGPQNRLTHASRGEMGVEGKQSCCENLFQEDEAIITLSPCPS